MLKTLFLLFFSFILSGKCLASIKPAPIGKVTKLEGKAFKLVPTVGVKRKRIELTIGMNIYELDIIATERSSNAVLEMVDETVLSLAANSSFEIKKFSYIPGIERQMSYHQSWGALRVKIGKAIKANESIQFNTKHVAVGAQESEFLSNSYSINNIPTNDLLLIRGKVTVNVDQLKKGAKTIELDEGMLFNSNLLLESGVSSFPRISYGLLQYLQSSVNAFLPRVQKSNGSYVNIAKVLNDLAFEERLAKSFPWTQDSNPINWSRYYPLN